jgi:hypothetical protein
VSRPKPANIHSNSAVLDRNGWSKGKYCSPLPPDYYGICIYFVNGLQPGPLPAFRAVRRASPRLRSERALASPGVRDRRAERMRPGPGHRHRDGSGATQPEELFEKPSRGDKPEPPIGHPPRVHRFDPRWTGAAALRSGLAQAPSRAYDLPHNRPRKRRRRRRPFRRFRFTGPGSPAMIRAQIIPQ